MKYLWDPEQAEVVLTMRTRRIEEFWISRQYVTSHIYSGCRSRLVWIEWGENRDNRGPGNRKVPSRSRLVVSRRQIDFSSRGHRSVSTWLPWQSGKNSLLTSARRLLLTRRCQIEEKSSQSSPNFFSYTVSNENQTNKSESCITMRGERVYATRNRVCDDWSNRRLWLLILLRRRAAKAVDTW